MKKIYVITGQTATGKTSYAINLAKKINGELINADSRQIYKNLDIVTGKDLDLTDGIFHNVSSASLFDIGYYVLPVSGSKLWLYDITNPTVHFSVYDYKICAKEAIAKILAHGKTPIIVGGSYLYIKNLLYNTINIHVPPDQTLRIQLSKLSVSELQNNLQKLNANTLQHMNQSDRQNPHRLIRKIEIEMTCKNNDKEPSHDSIYDQFKVTIEGFRYTSPKHLKNEIEKRVHDRLKNGAQNETEKLLEMGFSDKTPGLNAIGYKQIISYLQGKTTQEEMIEEWTTKEAQYAKRQYTFMKQNKDIVWTEL